MVLVARRGAPDLCLGLQRLTTVPMVMMLMMGGGELSQSPGDLLVLLADSGGNFL